MYLSNIPVKSCRAAVVQLFQKYLIRWKISSIVLGLHLVLRGYCTAECNAGQWVKISQNWPRLSICVGTWCSSIIFPTLGWLEWNLWLIQDVPAPPQTLIRWKQQWKEDKRMTWCNQQWWRWMLSSRPCPSADCSLAPGRTWGCIVPSVLTWGSSWKSAFRGPTVKIGFSFAA